MHELGITQRILEVALERAAQADATQITAVHLEIGEDSDVAPESVELYWPQVSRLTAAEGARLVFSSAADPDAFRITGIDVAELGRSAHEQTGRLSHRLGPAARGRGAISGG